MAQGDFSASYLAEIRIKQDNMFKAGRQKKELMTHLNTVEAFLARQNVGWNEILEGNKCIGAKAVWLKDCSAPDEDDATDITCDIEGNPIESVAQIYQPNFGHVERFSVTDDECKDVFSAQDKIAYRMQTAKKKLAEKFSAQLIAFMSANAQTNVWPEAPGITATGTTLQFDPTNENVDFLGRLHLVAEINEFADYYMVAGRPFWEANWAARFNNQNLDQKDQVGKIGSFDPIWDAKNFFDLDILDKGYIIEAGSAGAFFQNDYSNAAPMSKPGDRYAWREPLFDLKYNDNGTMKQVYVDIRMQEGCIIQEKTHRNSVVTGWDFELVLAGGLYLGPEDCNSGTGILEFEMAAEVEGV